MHVHACSISDVGLTRSSNEDNHLVDEELQLYAVCDGLGGHAAGEVAAETALRVTAEFIRDRQAILNRAHATPDGCFRVLQLAEDAVEHASQQLYRMARSDAALAGMGTTLTMLLIVGDKGVMSHVGDSRLYLVRDRKLHLLSSDHTLAHEMYQAGRMTLEQSVQSRYANVLTRAIGQQEGVDVESLLFDLLPNDLCLLCSDGLSNYFSDEDEVVRVFEEHDLEAVPYELVEIAKSGGGRDNITAIALRMEADAADDAPGRRTLRNQFAAMHATYLFQKLSLTRLTRLVNIATVNSYGPGETLLRIGDACDGMHLVIDGRLSATNREGAIQSLTAGHLYADTALLYKHKSRWKLVADEPSQVMLIHRKEFESLTRRFPKLGRLLLRRLGRHLSALVHTLSDSDVTPDDTVISN